MATFENARDFEQAIAMLFSRAGWVVTMPPANQKGYDFEAKRGNEVVAVQVKNYKAAVKVPQVEKFLEFLELPIARRFTRGFLITASSYSKQALTYFLESGQRRARLGLFRNDTVQWVNGQPIEPEAKAAEPLYLGVFTCKGGVGKTTVSAHLAGALAISGYDVALLDLDPQRNLTTLLGEGVKLPGSGKKPGNTVTIYSLDEWDEAELPDVRMVVCDCSPVLEENPRDLIKKFTYCIIPTTLNPLGLNKNGHVIKNTIEAIRKFNQTAYLFVLINNYFPDEGSKSYVLKEQYQRYFAELSQQDDRFQFLDPDEVSIRFSKQLFYWGYHIYSGDRNQLAFNPVGGRCLPKADFLNLLDFLEAHTTIESIKR